MSDPLCEVVVLDLDDTLYLEADYVRSGFLAVGELIAARFGTPDFAERALGRFVAGERGTIFDGAIEDCGIDAEPELITELVGCYRAHTPTLEPASDVPRFLDWAEGRVRLALLTDGPPVSQRAKLAALGVAGRFEAVVVTDELGGPSFRKPHRAGFDALMDSFPGVAPPQFTYLGDNPGKDLEGARAAGWRFVRVRRPGALHFSLPSPEGVAVPEVSALTDAIPILRPEPVGDRA